MGKRGHFIGIGILEQREHFGVVIWGRQRGILNSVELASGRGSSCVVRDGDLSGVRCMRVRVGEGVG